MRTLIVAAAASAAAILLPAAPAHADHPGPAVQSAAGQGGFGDRHDGRRDDRRRHRDFSEVFVTGPSGYSSDFDSNRSFDADKWNDWWHERPWRAYPAWVRNNQNCTPDRMWWQGGRWRC